MKKLLSLLSEAHIDQDALQEDYPASWSMEEFKELTSFKARIQYCELHLKRIGSGSARIVYAIDDEKALKLAKNAKGIAQNEAEADYFIQRNYGDVVTKLFDAHPDDLWVEMEIARKIKVADFRKLLGVDFENFARFMHNYGVEVHPSKDSVTRRIDQEVVDMLYEDEWVKDLCDMVSDTQMLTGDLTRMNSYGVVKRNGVEQIVVVDYGQTKSVMRKHYTKPKQPAYARW